MRWRGDLRAGLTLVDVVGRARESLGLAARASILAVWVTNAFQNDCQPLLKGRGRLCGRWRPSKEDDNTVRRSINKGKNAAIYMERELELSRLGLPIDTKSKVLPEHVNESRTCKKGKEDSD